MTDGPRLLGGILERHGISRTELARRAGFSSHTTVTRYIGNARRGVPPRGRGLEGETALRIADALAGLGVEALECRAFLEATGHQNLVPYITIAADSIEPASIDILGAPTQASVPSQLSIDQLLADSIRLSHHGERRGALVLARQAQRLSEGDVERWADITLRYCANYQQQIGEVGLALTEILSVKKGYFELVHAPHPGLRALFYTQLGWIEDQQHGAFQSALRLFTTALPLAQEAGDAALTSQIQHFLVRVHAEVAQAATGTWLGAWPTSGRRFAPELRHKVEHAVAHDLPAAQRLDPDNIHHRNRRFIAQALVAPRDALATLRQDEELYWHGSEHLLALNEARRDVSEAEGDWEAWGAAVSEAQDAFVGYCKQRLPQGIAQAAAIWSYAQRRRGLKEDEWQDYLDRWMLVLFLHPFKLHTLFQIAQTELVQRFSSSDPGDEQRYRRYLAGLDERVWSRNGVFAALDHVDVPLPYPWPREYLIEVLGNPVMTRLLRP